MSGKRGAIQKPLATRLMEKFEVTPDCWPWNGSLNDAGYGQIYDNVTRRPLRAHRVIFEMYRGPIPDGMVLDHLCRNRWCVNPDHLEPVTRGENVRRGARGGRQTHCRNGHEYLPETTYITPAGTRQCRVCKKALRVGSD